MKRRAQSESGEAATYACPQCSRQWAAIGGEAAERVCVCGAELEAKQMPPGLYELRAHDSGSARREPEVSARAEHDQGYGASHGYDATHGGPSGPGDAPAKPEADVALR